MERSYCDFRQAFQERNLSALLNLRYGETDLRGKVWSCGVLDTGISTGAFGWGIEGGFSDGFRFSFWVRAPFSRYLDAVREVEWEISPPFWSTFSQTFSP